MRCKNCGWPNKPNEKTCVKCHAPLDAENNGSFNEDIPAGGNVDADRLLNKTVMEKDVFGMPGKNQGHSEHRDEVPALCPKCGYPVRQGVNKCPNCKFQLDQSTVDNSRHFFKKQSDLDAELCTRPTRMSNEEENKRSVRGTVNPYMMNLDLDPSFVLKPLKRVNERHDPEEQEYEGREVILNRENTEQSNASITSRQQAIVTHSEGHWYIEDRSEQKTTFVQAAGRIELHDGDIILLGNRLFEFHS